MEILELATAGFDPLVNTLFKLQIYRKTRLLIGCNHCSRSGSRNTHEMQVGKINT